MFVTWKPEDGSEDRTYDFDPDDLLTSEAKAIEKAFGGTWEEWLNGLRTGNAKARQILLWHLLRQEHRSLRLDDIPDFRMRQLKVEMSVRELRELLETVSKTKMDDRTREMAVSAIERDIVEAMERETGVMSGEVVEGDRLPKLR